MIVNNYLTYGDLKRFRHYFFILSSKKSNFLSRKALKSVSILSAIEIQKYMGKKNKKNCCQVTCHSSDWKHLFLYSFIFNLSTNNNI